jgi:hypothetical protein
MLDVTPRCINAVFERHDTFYRHYELARDEWLREHPKHTAEEYLAALRQIMKHLSQREE